jgi:5-hydroxyisourate hydrolase
MYARYGPGAAHVCLRGSVADMSSISTHVLDLVRGRPAAGVRVTLEQLRSGAWEQVAHGQTDADGRIKDLVPRGSDISGVFRITFETKSYFETIGSPCFYPHVPIVFEVPSPGEHYHVPLLVGPYGYSTYRGS